MGMRMNSWDYASDWGPGRRASLDWVRPNDHNRTKEEAPYAYGEHFLWRDGEKVDPSRGTFTAWSAPGVEAAYSDRLQQWSAENWRRALAAVPQNGQMRYWGPEAASAFLTAYFQKPTAAVALAEGCNPSSGYPYWILWFAHREEAQAAPAAD